jgi:hypothetical protein
MNHQPSPQPSFSTGRKWAIGFNVAVSIAAALALVVMVNYLAARHYLRVPLNAARKTQLSPQTVRVLRSITNEVKVTVFFVTHDTDERGEEELYRLTTAVLREYNYINPKIVFKTVDPTRFPAEAELVLSRYKLSGLKDKNFILFDCEDRTKVIYANELSDYDISAVLSGRSREFRRVSFKGEQLFTTTIFNLTQPRQSKVCFLDGHGEHDPARTEHPHGYAKFAAILRDENNAQWEKLSLLGTNDMPADCQLLVIAGARLPFEDSELEKISRFLKQGGRLFVLMANMAYGGSVRTGLEKLLAQWSVGVADNMVFDPKYSPTGNDLLTAQLNNEHSIMKALVSDSAGLRVRLVLPRAVGKSTTATANPDAPKVDVLAATSEDASEAGQIRDGVPYRNPYIDRKGIFPLMVAVERGRVKGVTTERGSMRMVVVGDSLALDNELIDSTPANHSFAALAVNWLLDRPQIVLEGLVPSPLKTYRLVMARREVQAAQWILMGVMPGAALFLGALVWWRRRK